MGDEGQLSQDEIDALLSGSSDFDFDKSGDDSSGGGESDAGADDDLLDLLGGGPPSGEEASSGSSGGGATQNAAKSKPKVVETQGKYDYKESGNMGLLLDVMMNLSIELGRTTKEIKEVLNYGEGSIVELDKHYGDLVDIMVNGRLFARGEVVIIDETYGIRVIEIVNPEERHKMLF